MSTPQRVAILVRSHEISPTTTEVVRCQLDVDDLKKWVLFQYGIPLDTWEMRSSTPDPEGTYSYKDSSMTEAESHRIVSWQTWFNDSLFLITIEDIIT